ncbi:uncharacterized protein PAC_14471 [Phialocephala subalpina]|uniref:Uncharacterized protein n=1 Tax=Phialocephala subalpina TaxID=576137 RepID=A0A1L7XHQ3_9HELO|nr:uncharacterized protein PAC_14471 [Phialocephala subalpina]
MRFTQLLMAFAVTFASSAMAREDKFFCRVEARQLERGVDFKDDENRFECKGVDDKSPFCCKYSEHDDHGAKRLECKAADLNDHGSTE